MKRVICCILYATFWGIFIQLLAKSFTVPTKHVTQPACETKLALVVQQPWPLFKNRTRSSRRYTMDIINFPATLSSGATVRLLIHDRTSLLCELLVEAIKVLPHLLTALVVCHRRALILHLRNRSRIVNERAKHAAPLWLPVSCQPTTTAFAGSKSGQTDLREEDLKELFDPLCLDCWPIMLVGLDGLWDWWD